MHFPLKTSFFRHDYINELVRKLNTPFRKVSFLSIQWLNYVRLNFKYETEFDICEGVMTPATLNTLYRGMYTLTVTNRMFFKS